MLSCMLNRMRYHSVKFRYCSYPQRTVCRNPTLSPEYPKPAQQLIQSALDRISTGFTDNELTIQSLAESCGISGTYLRKIFADCLGMTPQEYIINRRLEYAGELLCSGQFSVLEVAQMCGYFEPCHFSGAFTKHTGVSPRAYTKAQVR